MKRLWVDSLGFGGTQLQLVNFVITFKQKDHGVES